MPLPSRSIRPAGLCHLALDRALYWFRLGAEQRVIQLLAVFFAGQNHQRRMLVRLLQTSSEVVLRREDPPGSCWLHVARLLGETRLIYLSYPTITTEQTGSYAEVVRTVVKRACRLWTLGLDVSYWHWPPNRRQRRRLSWQLPLINSPHPVRPHTIYGVPLA